MDQTTLLQLLLGGISRQPMARSTFEFSPGDDLAAALGGLLTDPEQLAQDIRKPAADDIGAQLAARNREFEKARTASSSGQRLADAAQSNALAGQRADQLAALRIAQQKARGGEREQPMMARGAPGQMIDYTPFTRVAQQLAADPRIALPMAIARAEKINRGGPEAAYRVGETLRSEMATVKERDRKKAELEQQMAELGLEDAKFDLSQKKSTASQSARDRSASRQEQLDARYEAQRLAREAKIKAEMEERAARRDAQRKTFRDPEAEREQQMAGVFDPFNIGQATANKYLSLLSKFLR